MSNPRPMPRKPVGAQDLVGRTRKGILGAFDAVENRGMKISDLLADAFIENPLKFMDTVSKYIPKDINLDAAISHNAEQLTDEELAAIIATRARQRFENAKEIKEIDHKDEPIEIQAIDLEREKVR